MSTTTHDTSGRADDVRHILELADAIRPMPVSVRKLAQVVADEYGQLGDVAAVVREDPMLASNLLQEANSAASSPVNRITTIEAAITRLGLARVMAVASLAVFGPEAKKPLEAYRIPAGALIEHSLRASYVAEAAFGLVDGQLDSSVVTAALLHDLGKLALDLVLDRDSFAQAIQEGVIVTNAEREQVTVDHAELGALMLETWSLPDCLVTAVRYHHDPFAVADPGPRGVALADLVTHMRYSTGGIDCSADVEILDSLLTGLGLELDELVSRADRLMERTGFAVAG
jgi:putative nucleotidyltransferase with HDIG domain